MKNLVLCFDRARDHPGMRSATNAETLLRLLDKNGDQLTWYHSGVSDSGRRLRWWEAAADDARAAITEAYEFLIDWWQPGDRIFVFGVGRGGHCAHALARLLGTVGMLPELMDYVLAAYAMPRTRRTPEDWLRVTRLAAELAGNCEIGVPVEFLGLWDVKRIPGAPRSSEPLNVRTGRHAVAVDGGHGPFGEHVPASDNLEEVWFRGAHCDVAGGPGACWPLAGITLDWMLDGAVRAGIAVRPGYRYTAPTPSEFDALAESARTVSLRRLPYGALVHASVDVYLREHPQYWRRLPAHVVWADMDWLARSERLVQAPSAPKAVAQTLTAVAS
ncbi:MAG TPA: DUF2235 domain-containing protein [Mycobacterium sp.]|nr:DUF2235 domain-containing protein [Mycobacterium sp.]